MRDQSSHRQTDPLSAASSGLVALGLNWEQRAETLALLAALIDLADDSGEVLLDSSLLRVEERLGIDLCLHGYERLEELAIIHRTWSGWVIRNFATHTGPEGKTLDSMEVVRRHGELLRQERTAEPTRVPAEEAAPVVTIGTWRRRVPLMVAGVAAGLATVAGATQFVPQAAVTTQHASNQATVTTVVPTIAPTVAATPTTAAPTDTTAAAPAATVAPTTTTSTTMLPGLPCLSDVLKGKKALLPKTGEDPLTPLLDC